MPNLRDVVREWQNLEVTVVNPQSYVESMLKDALHMESYQATVAEVGEDYLRLHYTAQKKREEQPVDQVIPLAEIKRVSTWGDERILHL